MLVGCDYDSDFYYGAAIVKDAYFDLLIYFFSELSFIVAVADAIYR